MMAVNDNMFKALQDAGYTGALSDMLYQWLGTFSDNPNQSISDLWREALINLSGLPEEDFQFNDYYSAYLTGRGYAGAFSDQLNSFWEDVANGVIDLPTGGGSLFDGNYADYPLINNGNNTVAAGSVLNENQDGKNPLLITGIVSVPPYKPSIFPNHDVDGNATAGTLSEQDFTNQLLSSNVFNPLNGATITENAAVAPDGTSTAVLLGNIVQGLAGDRMNCQSDTGTSIDGRVCTGGLWMKGTSNSVGQSITLGIKRRANGTSTPSNTEIVLTDEWVRYEGTFTGQTDNEGISVTLRKSLTSTANEVYIWGAQGQYDTTKLNSYAPTSGAEVTVSADQDSVPTSNVFVDSDHGISGTGTVSLVGTKYDGVLNVDCVGTLFYDENGVRTAEITTYSANSIGISGTASTSDFIAFQTSAYTLLGAVNVANAIDRIPETETGSSLSPTAIASGVVISENTAAIDGNYTEFDNLVGGLIADKDILQGDYLTIEFDADIVQGSLLAQVGGVQEPVTQGTNKFVLKGAGGTAPIGIELPIIVAAETGDIEATCSNIKFTVTRWLHWPTDDFTLNITVTPTETDTDATGQLHALFGVNANTDDGMFFQYNTSTASYQLIQYQGGAAAGTLWQKAMSPIPYGQTTEISIDFSSSSDTVIRFVGVVVVPEQAQSISGTYSWGNTFAIGHNLDASNRYYNGVYAALEVKDTVIAP